MTVRVIRPPTEYITQCNHCGSILGFTIKDVSEYPGHDMYNPMKNPYYIKCAHCGHSTQLEGSKSSWTVLGTTRV